MPRQIVPLTEQHVDAAAGLLAARHARDRESLPLLPDAFASADACRPLIHELLVQDGVDSFAAVRDGELHGFIFGTPFLPAPTHFMALFFPPRAMAVPYHGHAVVDNDAVAIYRELYAALAGGWVERGYFDHFVNVSPADDAAREAWDSLGFGRELTCAIREVAGPVTGARELAGVEVHAAGAEDIAVIEALNDTLMAHHARSPIFAPQLPEPRASSREFALSLMADAANPHFVAYRNGAALGLNSFMPPSFLSPMLVPPACVYLLQGVVTADARGGGVGKALLAHSMSWAQEQGHGWCALHFAAPNISGASFWQSNGFRPVEFRLHRHVDERVAWAGPQEGEL